MLAKQKQLEILFDGVPLSIVTSYKYLGLTLDNQLNYNLHITKVISLVTAKLKQFPRMRCFFNVKAATMVYKGMILPIREIFLSTASVENRKRLQTLQNKSLRCALNKGFDTSSVELHTEAKLLKL